MEIQPCCVWKGLGQRFPTHYQPYPHHIPNVLDLRPKWPHESKIQKSKFSIFPWNPSNFRFVQIFLVAPTIQSLRGQIHWVMIFQTHYQPYQYDTENKLRWLSKLHTKSEKSKKSKIQIQNSWNNSQKFTFRGKKFKFFSIMWITVSPIELRKKFHRLTHICSIRS